MSSRAIYPCWCVTLFCGALAALLSFAAADPAPPVAKGKPPAVQKSSAAVTATSAGEPSAANAASIARLTQSNQDLIDLLKKQQAVLEDIQYDRRLQNRQISSLEDRLQEAMEQNAQLQGKVAVLEAQIAVTPLPSPGGSRLAPAATTNTAPAPPSLPPPPPASFLPAPETEGAPGTKSWHRLFTLSGSDGKNSDVFHIEGRQWRVLWHNQDQAGKAYTNTSALFINSFLKSDTVPQKVCSKLGSGGDSTELDGPGNFFLKVEASGGAWELAVEDFK